jgi:hypothetical protein
MHRAEFAIFFGALLVPPLLLAFAVLAIIRATGLLHNFSWLNASVIIVALSTAIALACVVLGPSWLARYFGVQDLHILGVSVTWAPFAFVAVGISVATAIVLCSKRGQQ